MYLSVRVAAPTFWHIVAHMHDDTYQLYVPNTLRHLKFKHKFFAGATVFNIKLRCMFLKPMPHE